MSDAKLPQPVSAAPPHAHHATAQPRRPYTMRHALRDVFKGFLIAMVILFPSQTVSYASDIAHGAWHWPWSPRHVRTNVILMISDGYGPASVAFTRHFAQALINDTHYDSPFQLPLDTILVGTHRSRSSSSLITDSAAGATAFSCAKKSYNGAIGVTPDAKPCGTVFEAAKRNGLLTGVVVTSRLTDATPAAFISHAASRAQEPLIASQLIGGDKNPLGQRTLDLAIGGGGCAFLPNSSTSSCRLDDEDTVQLAKDLGWDVRLSFPSDASSLHRADVFAHAPEPTLPFMALLSPGNTPYEIDRINAPRAGLKPLKHFASKALQILGESDQNKHGFILMIEGSQIDLCAHNNDPACHAREALAYHDAIQMVKQWVDRHNSRDERTLLISTSDHETGGVTLGRQLTPDYPNYAYYPERLLEAKHSTPVLTAVLIEFVRLEQAKAKQAKSHVSEKRVKDFIRHSILGSAGLGFHSDRQGGKPTDDEVEAVFSVVKDEILSPHVGQQDLTDAVQFINTAGTTSHHVQDHTVSTRGPVPGVNLDGIRRAISDVAARRAEIGFSTSGHTGIDINVYAHGYGLHDLIGNQDNTNIGSVIQKLLNLDLDAVTRDLNK